MTASEQRFVATLCLKLSHAVEALENIVGIGDADDARLLASEALTAIERVEASHA